MYKEDILNLIQSSPLEIDTEIQMSGRPPTMANSEFLTNKEQGDWAEQVVYKAINEFSDDFFAVQYGRTDSIAAGEDGFTDFYIEYQNELNTIGKKPDLLIFKLTDFPDKNIAQARLSKHNSKDGRYCAGKQMDTKIQCQAFLLASIF